MNPRKSPDTTRRPKATRRPDGLRVISPIVFFPGPGRPAKESCFKSQSNFTPMAAPPGTRKKGHPGHEESPRTSSDQSPDRLRAPARRADYSRLAEHQPGHAKITDCSEPDFSTDDFCPSHPWHKRQSRKPLD